MKKLRGLYLKIKFARESIMVLAQSKNPGSAEQALNFYTLLVWIAACLSFFVTFVVVTVILNLVG